MVGPAGSGRVVRKKSKSKKINMKRTKIVVIGGGTGTSTLVSAMKPMNLDMTAIVTVADSGGSTGRLRDEFGFQPVGDLRQSLAALADEGTQEWIRKLLLYRFEKGDGLSGHNLGNLILTALQDMAGSTASALEIAEKIFRLDGKIFPVTQKNVQLVIELKDGTVLLGEDHLNDTKQHQEIKSVRLSPNAELYELSKQAIQQASVICVGPGDVYGSIVPALAVKGLKKAVQTSKSKIVFFVNLMNRANQTHQWPASKHLQLIEKYLGTSVDHIFINDAPVPKNVLKLYLEEGETLVTNDLANDSRTKTYPFISIATTKQSESDVVKRSLIRHDADQIRKAVSDLLH